MDDEARQRAEMLVEEMLVFIEKTSGRKIKFSTIVNLKTGTQENPQDRLVKAMLQYGDREYRRGLEEAAKAIDERIEYICHDYHEEPLGDLEWYHRDLLERTVEDLKAVLARLAQEARRE